VNRPDGHQLPDPGRRGDRTELYVRRRRAGAQQAPPERPQSQDPGDQQPPLYGGCQRCPVLDHRDLPRQDARIPLGLSLVGRPAGLRHGVHPLLRGLVPVLRLETCHPAPGDRRVVRCGPGDDSRVRRDIEVDLRLLHLQNEFLRVNQVILFMVVT